MHAASTTEILLVAMTIILTVPYLVWGGGGPSSRHVSPAAAR
jgi:hypothetical protein